MFNYLLFPLFYFNIVRAHNLFMFDQYSKLDSIESNSDVIAIDCHTSLDENSIGYRYRLEAHTVEEGKICDLKVPSRFLVAIETSFYDPETYFRVVGSNGNQGWSVGLPRVFSYNSTIPYHGHERKDTSVWFTPCKRSAILLNAKHSKDAVIFMMKKVEKRFLYKNPIECDDFLDIF